MNPAEATAAEPVFLCVHGLAQAVAGLQAVQAAGRRAVLVSGEGAAGFGGCLWWQALAAAADEAVPDTLAGHVLDCADAPGYAMGALREGQMQLVLDPLVPAFAAVRAAAMTLGATVLAARPPALDMSEPGAEYRLRQSLAGRPGALPLDPAGVWKPQTPVL